MSGKLLSPARVLTFETRHEAEMARLIEKQGGQALRAPSMREVPLADQQAAIEFGARVVAGQCDVLILLTGTGTTTLLDAMSIDQPRSSILEALGRMTLACRGPKPLRVLRALGLDAAVVAPEPNTSIELLTVLERDLDLRDQRVAVQEYGAAPRDLLWGLERLGARVTRVPVYSWQLPEDTMPLENAVRSLIGGEVDVALFTSAMQAQHLFEIAGRTGDAARVKQELASHVVVASIGPVTSDALREHGIAPDTEPEHPKMGQLVTHVARVWQDLRAAKTGRHPRSDA
jgi:uroporphyrinogen-III synthase